jgi:hypothetical protein
MVADRPEFELNLAMFGHRYVDREISNDGEHLGGKNPQTAIGFFAEAGRFEVIMLD